MNKKLFVLSFIFFFTILCFSQDNHGIIIPKYGEERNSVCQNCINVFNNLPKEVGFKVENKGGNLYFVTRHKEWLIDLFKNPTDGMAIDVISKHYYSCNKNEIPNVHVKGVLLKPVYSKKILSQLKSQKNNNNKSYKVLVGSVPNQLKNKELEYNIIFLQNNNYCRYNTIFDIKSYSFELLDMGMYLQNISFKNEKVQSKDEESAKIRYKTLKFIIPFKKGKSIYSAEDLKPLYDSLNLTDFSIKEIDIKAYSSVEGSLESNIKLQKERGNSIIKAIQSYQKPTIKTSINSSENWVEFYEDIKGTKYENLKSLSKPEVKRKLIGAFSKEMEPILEKHRKAVITLKLEKIDRYKDMSAQQLVENFNQSITKDNLDEASKIQNSLFEKLKYEEISPDFLNKLEIPKQKKYINFLNNNAGFEYQLNKKRLYYVRNDLKKLEELDPKNPKVKYNLVATKFPIWRYDWKEINSKDFKNEILNLKNYGISKNLIDRMMVNYEIVLAEKFNRKRDYPNKDKSVNKILSTYKKIELKDLDYFCIAQFLVYYSNIEKATELLSDKVKQLDVDEDLLFYYLNLTLINPELTKTDNYRTIVLNAVNINRKRYCKLFNSIENGGVTFQLLKDKNLRSDYCENCVNTKSIL